jgi:hypothetical protein
MNMNISEIQTRVRACGRLLSDHRTYWSIHPFEKDTFDWEHTNPDLSLFLRSWTNEEVEAFERCPHLHPKAPRELKEIASQCSELTKLPILYREEIDLPASMSLHIKERKWKQIVSFISSLHPKNDAFVDWCCGKGHLGRVLSSLYSVPVYGLEYNMDLVEKGKNLALSGHNLYCCDVLHDEIPFVNGSLLALHSCGDLLERAMEVVVAQELSQCVLVSCCFHKIVHEERYPLSKSEGVHGFMLNRHELRIPSTFEHRASKTKKRRRRNDMRYRIALDLILRDLGLQKSYSSIPSVPDGWKDETLEGYIGKICVREKIVIPSSIDFGLYEQKAHKKLCMIRGLSSLRSLFSRVLEVWLNGDRALWLYEQGYDVEMGICMPEEITPRNIVLKGIRRSQSTKPITPLL